jgi:glycosyltransferase involved in cell wall biosynthesis
LKGKVTQSLAAGLPVVTTSIGAEGLEAVDGQQLLIADDNDELAERVIRVLRDDELWAQLSRSGQELADARCSPAIMKERLSELLSGDRSPVAPA